MSAFQGFDINLNLRENISDRDVLNNLGGAPIADDVTLFLNNLRNTSTLTVSLSEIQENYIRFNPNLQRFVFTNGTKISVEDLTFFVGDSNTINEFRLYQNKELTELVNNPPTGIYSRSDAVSYNDIVNLVRFRDRVVENISLSQVGTLDSSLDRSNIYDSYIRVFDEVLGRPTTLSSYFNSIEREIDLFELNKQTSINNYFNFTSDNRLSLSGNILVFDPDGENNTTVSTTNGPGIFIFDTGSNQSKRAFSSNENLWEDTGTALAVSSKEIVVGNLVFNQTPKIVRKSGSPNLEIETNTVTTFTHFVKAKVNGEDYYLCLK
jgi:hypothetical protein